MALIIKKESCGVFLFLQKKELEVKTLLRHELSWAKSGDGV